MPRLLSVPQGGTAVGTGLNRHRDFDRVFCERLAALTNLPFTPNPNKFEGMGAHDALRRVVGRAEHACRVAQQARQRHPPARLGSTLPASANSSFQPTVCPRPIMPGKTNPTQSEALTMVARR